MPGQLYSNLLCFTGPQCHEQCCESRSKLVPFSQFFDSGPIGIHFHNFVDTVPSSEFGTTQLKKEKKVQAESHHLISEISRAIFVTV